MGKLKKFIMLLHSMGFVIGSDIGFANPVLSGVSAGNISVSQSPGVTTINQTTNRGIINWQSFNINNHESTRFIQPAGGATLNRISPLQGASQIYGSLTATGRIILINSAGIYFGPNAYVNVGGIIATTADIADQDFLNNKYHFIQNPNSQGSIINAGTIVAANHGLVALLGNNVRNDGLIQANLGHAVMGSGREYAMTFQGNDLISFTVSGGTLGRGITNTGGIIANGGNVLIKAQAARGVLDNVINMRGYVQAQSVSPLANGGVVFSGGSNGNVYVAANINASGRNKNFTGGNVKITGNHILVDSSTKIDVSGESRGGSIVIGRDPSTSEISNSTIIKPGTNLLANTIYGNGGLVETSGKYLAVNGINVDTRSTYGSTGTWLLDPTDLIICSACTTTAGFSSNTFGAGATNSNLLVNDLISALNNSNVVVQTAASGTGGNGDIYINTPVTYSSPYNLTLTAYRHIIGNESITNNSFGNVSLIADNTGTGIGTVSFAAGKNISLNGGTASIYYNPALFGLQETIYTGGTAPVQYMLINQLGAPTDSAFTTDTPSLATLSNTPGLWFDNYALSRDIDASSTISWNGGLGFSSIGNNTLPFFGTFDGLGHVIKNVYINQIFQQSTVGFFGLNVGTIQNLGLVNEHVTVMPGYGYYGSNDVGGLVGDNYGTLSNVYISNLALQITPGGFANWIGGLAGYNAGLIINAYTSGVVNGGGSVVGAVSPFQDTQVEVGGLVGRNKGYVVFAYSTAKVISDGFITGGLVGVNTGTIFNSYSSGLVTGPGRLGGLVGSNSVTATDGSGKVTTGTIIASVWDKQTSGVTTSGGGIGLSTALLLQGSTYASLGFDIGIDPNSSTWVIIDGSTRPMLSMEFSKSIATPHALQLLGINSETLSQNYSLSNNIDLSVANNPSEIWAGNGFVPIGNNATPFTGSFDGSGYAITNLNLLNQIDPFQGLFGATSIAASLPNVIISGINVRANYPFNYTVVSDANSIFVRNLWLTLNLNPGTLTICDSCVNNLTLSGNGYGSSSNLTLPSADLTTLLGIGSVILQTSGSAGDIFINSPVNYTSNNNLTLRAFRNIFGNGNSIGNQSIIHNFGSGNVSLIAGSAGTGIGTVSFAAGKNISLNGGSVKIYYNATVFGIQDVIYNTGVGITTPTQYMFVNNATQLHNINSFLNQNFALSKDINLNNQSFTAIGSIGTPFTGLFDGLGHLITNLNVSGITNVGLFAATGASASISNLGVSGVVNGANNVGMLVGNNAGTLSSIMVNGLVNGTTNNIGGLVGTNSGNVSDVESLTAVSAAGASLVGGIAGSNSGTISNALAAGNVAGLSTVGGLVGNNSGNILNSLWDSNSTGSNVAAGSNPGMLTATDGCFTGICSSGNNLSMMGPYSLSGWNFASTWSIVPNASYPYLLSIYPNTPRVVQGNYSTYASVLDNSSWAPMADALKNPDILSLIPVATGNLQVTLANSGNIIDTTYTGADGAYYFIERNNIIADADPLLIYLSNGTAKANTITLAPSSGRSITSMPIIQNTLFQSNGIDPTPFNSVHYANALGGTVASPLGTLSGDDILYTMIGSNGYDMNINVKSGFNFVANSPLVLYGDLNTTNGSITFNSFLQPGLRGAFTGDETVQTNLSGNILINTIEWPNYFDASFIANNTLNVISANNILLAQIFGAANDTQLRQLIAGRLNLSAAFTDKSITINPISYIRLYTFNLAKGKWFQQANEDGSTGFYIDNNFSINSGIMPTTQAEFLRIAGGDGTPASPFLLIDRYGFQGIGSDAYTLSRSYALSSSYLDYDNSAFWNNGLGWVPIGNLSLPFSGTFDGSAVSDINSAGGIVINRPNEDNVGIFGVTSPTAIIANFAPISIAVTGRNNVGIIVGYNQGLLFNDNTINNFVVGQENVGGLVGYNAGTIINSSSLYNRILGFMSNAGGIAGVNIGTIEKSLSATFVGGGSYLGGIAGINSGLIKNSFWDTDVTGQSKAAFNISSGQLVNVYPGCFAGLPCSNGGYVNLTDKRTYLTSADGGFGFVNSSWDFNNIFGIIPGYTYPYSKYLYGTNPLLNAIHGRLSPGSGNQAVLLLLSAVIQNLGLFYNIIGFPSVTGADGSFYYLANITKFNSNGILYFAVVGGNVQGSIAFKYTPGVSINNLIVPVAPSSGPITNNLALYGLQIAELFAGVYNANNPLGYDFQGLFLSANYIVRFLQVLPTYVNINSSVYFYYTYDQNHNPIKVYYDVNQNIQDILNGTSLSDKTLMDQYRIEKIAICHN